MSGCLCAYPTSQPSSQPHNQTFPVMHLSSEAIQLRVEQRLRAAMPLTQMLLAPYMMLEMIQAVPR